MKKIGVIVCFCFILLTIGINIIVFTKVSDKEKIEKDEGISVGVSLSYAKKTGVSRLKKELELQCSKLYINVNIKDSKNSEQKQLENIKELVRSGINVLMIDAVNSNSKKLKLGIEFAIINDVEVIFLNSFVDEFEEETSAITFNDYILGQEVVKKIETYRQNNNISKKMKAIILRDNDNTNTIKFNEGVQDNNLSKIDVDFEYCLDDVTKADIYDCIEKYMCDYGKIDAIICTSDEMASVCLEVIKENELDIIVTGQDCTLEACKRISTETGQICSVYKPYDEMVKSALTLAQSFIFSDGKKDNISINMQMVDGSNLMQVVVGKGLYQAAEIFAVK